MVRITKSEKEIIVRELPNAHITRTMKAKSDRHCYYCEESSAAMELLNEIRANAIVQEVGGTNGVGKKTR